MARTKRTTTNPRSAFPIRRMILLDVLLLTTLRLIPDGVSCLCRRLIHRSAWRNCLENSRGSFKSASSTARSGRSSPFAPTWPPPEPLFRDTSRFSKQFRKVNSQKLLQSSAPAIFLLRRERFAGASDLSAQGPQRRCSFVSFVLYASHELLVR